MVQSIFLFSIGQDKNQVKNLPGGMLVPEEISVILSSDPGNGASNRSPDGSYFEIQLQDGGLNIPKDALNINIVVEEATVWWVVPNILTDVNDRLYITAPNTLDVPTPYTVVIPKGLYDLAALNTAIQRNLSNQGAKVSPLPVISLAGDQPTQRVIITFNYPTVSIDFTQPGTLREILGFNSQILGTYPGAPVLVSADTTASFNTVNYFLLHSDLTSKGIRFNNDYNQTIAQILIDVAPGSQIVSKPFNPARVNAPELAGSKRSVLRVWLTDDQDNRVDTNGEYFTARIVIHYLRPYVIGKG